MGKEKITKAEILVIVADGLREASCQPAATLPSMIDAETEIGKFGLDSLDAVEMDMLLEEELDITLDGSDGAVSLLDWEKYKTVGELVDAVEAIYEKQFAS